jgi:hypothetical protein
MEDPKSWKDPNFPSVSIDAGVSALVDTQTDTHPRPIYKRGVWMDRTDVMRLKNFRFNHTFTIHMWIKVTNGTGTLLSVTTDDLRNDVFVFFLSSN